MGIDLSKSPSLAQRVYAQLAHDASTKGMAVSTDKIVGNTMTRTVATKSPAKRRSRKNASNDGRPFQDRVIRTANAYFALGVLKLAKVDAPTKFIRGKIVCMENPFLDFVGCWHRNGRMIVIEAKSTKDHLLRLCRDGGITQKQFNSMAKWAKSGAITGLLWECDGNTKWWPHEEINEWNSENKKSLVFESGGVEVLAGKGFIEIDFAEIWTNQGL